MAVQMARRSYRGEEQVNTAEEGSEPEWIDTVRLSAQLFSVAG